MRIRRSRSVRFTSDTDQISTGSSGATHTVHAAPIPRRSVVIVVDPWVWSHRYASYSARQGDGASDHTSPSSRSARYRNFPHSSRTRSISQRVSTLSWLLSSQENPPPFWLTTSPYRPLEITLTHGIGVRGSVIENTRPLGSNLPNRLPSISAPNSPLPSWKEGEDPSPETAY